MDQTQDEDTVEDMSAQTGNEDTTSATDEQVIEILAINIGLGAIHLTEFGDDVQTDSEISMEKSVMEELAERYFESRFRNIIPSRMRNIATQPI